MVYENILLQSFFVRFNNHVSEQKNQKKIDTLKAIQVKKIAYSLINFENIIHVFNLDTDIVYTAIKNTLK
jgi:hypothetical protein